MPPTIGSRRLGELADGVFVHTSTRALTTSTVISLGGGDCLLVDPAMEPPDLAEIASLIEEVGLNVVMGWSTHPHWDHVLWSSAFGREVPRYGTRKNSTLCASELAELHAYLEKECPGHETSLCGLISPIDEQGVDWPASCEVMEHEGHAPGHGALWLADRGVLVAGDMVSDIEIPTLDLEQEDPIGDYYAALESYGSLGADVSVFIPGHGHAGTRDELTRRIGLDRRYLDDLVAARETIDDRRTEEWLRVEHERQFTWCREHLD